MVFNWKQELKVLPKPYIDPAVPVAGKYTFCKLEQLEKVPEKLIEPTTVGILINYTHSNCVQLWNANWKLLQVLMEGNIRDLKL